MYLTMEYVEGISLHALVQQRGPLPIPLALGILAEAADALHHAHSAGVVHRDIKPHNMVLADHPNGKIVRILDFGMAKILGSGADEGMMLTAGGAIFGTPQYMSPEQCRGAPPDPRTDLYALGCVAFELLLGETPFRGGLAMLFAAHLTTPPRKPSTVDPDAGIPAELDAIDRKCPRKVCRESVPERRRALRSLAERAGVSAASGFASKGISMPDSVSFDIKQLVRVCLNDPDLRAEITAAVEAGPLPVRTAVVHVVDDGKTYESLIKSDRNKSPGDPGFILRDGLGWVSGRLTEIVQTDHDASTISAEQMAEKLGMSAEEYARKRKGG